MCSVNNVAPPIRVALLFKQFLILYIHMFMFALLFVTDESNRAHKPGKGYTYFF